MENKQQTLANQLLSDNFTQTGETITTLTDPLVDTPMVITLDQLKPYDNNPRITRNPLYDEIKLSIRERGLDSSPGITRRPGDSLFMIRNGGNTRLSILKELWEETHEERFFKIHCLFSPWKDEVTVLTGHIVEDRLHGKLTFIERALAVVNTIKIYDKEHHITLSQRQLAKQLTQSGYPISQTLVSNMLDTVNYLLPAIPDTLYAGLSRTTALKILKLRKAANTIWLKYTNGGEQTYTFDDMLLEVLSLFNLPTIEFDFNRCQDELIARIAQLFECNYDVISFELVEKQKTEALLEKPSSDTSSLIDEKVIFVDKKNNADIDIDESAILSIPLPKTPAHQVIVTKKNHYDSTIENTSNMPKAITVTPPVDEQDIVSDNEDAFINQHIVSLVESTPRLDAINHKVSSFANETEPDFKTNVVKSVPVQAGGDYIRFLISGTSVLD